MDEKLVKIRLQLSDVPSAEDVYDILGDNDIINYESDLDIISDTLTLGFDTEENKEIACDVIIDFFGIKVQ